MSKAKEGDTVKVHYTGKLKDGKVFDTSREREPLEFTVGDGKVIQGFENAVIGMGPEDTKTVELSSDKAYGPYRKELVASIEKKDLPKNVKPEIGQRLQARQDDGSILLMTVTDTDESSITVDANHPLAGQDVVFDIELLEIK